jgi:hypothetical protein
MEEWSQNGARGRPAEPRRAAARGPAERVANLRGTGTGSGPRANGNTLLISFDQQTTRT